MFVENICRVFVAGIRQKLH